MASTHMAFGGQGSLLHFSHANGYPPQAYQSLLTPFLSSHRVIASLHRPLWEPPIEPETFTGWQQFGDDVLAMVSDQEEAVLSLGHSMGAAAVVMAASRRAEKFRGIVMIEPVLVPRAYTLLLRLFRGVARRRVPLIRRTLERTDRWPGKQEAFAHFRPKSVFKAVSDEVLWDYVEHGMIEESDGSCRLRYSKQWEVQCYLHVYNLWHLLPRLDVPVLAMRGSESNTVNDRSWRRWQSMARQTRFVEIAGASHLLPLERPEKVVTEIRKWLNSSSG